MATMRHSIQKEVFEGSSERLLVVCEVAKFLKKKKTSYLCIVNNIELPASVGICQVKKMDKNGFKKKRTWLLSEIKNVDGGTDPTVLTLDIMAEKQYRWIALSEHDRQHFVTSLNQMAAHNKAQVDFKNFPHKWLSSGTLQSPDSPLIIPNNPMEAEIGYEYQTDLDDVSDLMSLLGNCDSAVSNAEQFMSQLGDKLSILDTENIESMLASEAQVESLMDRLEEAIKYAEVVEGRLDRYDEILCHIRDTMDKMEEKNGMIETANRNSQRLLHQLESIITWLDINAASMDVVLTTPEGREAALNAGNVLRNAMTAPLPDFAKKMKAYQDQYRKINSYKEKFSQSLVRHLRNLLKHLSNDASQDLPTLGPDFLTLPSRDNIHEELMEYAPLMHWTKQMDAKEYNELTKVYTSSLSKLYDRDIKQFFEHARQRIGGNTSTAGGGKKSLKDDGSNHSTSSYSFDAILETVLSQLEPICLSEQQFCVAFFQLDGLKSGQQSMDGSFNADTSAVSLVISPSSDELSGRDLSPGSVELSTTGESVNRSRQEKSFSEDVRKVMAELFPSLEQELAAFIAHYERLDAYGCMQTLVVVGSHVLSARDAGSLLSVSLGSCLVQAKRACDSAMRGRLTALQEPCKTVMKRNKCAVLPYVESFEEFCKTAESIFSKSNRRADLDKWYVQLVSAMMQAISRQEHPKTPHQVIKMENFHHLYSLLCQLKIPALNELRKEAKVKYNEALKAYVTYYFGRPLEKLNLFFEGVESRMSQGVNRSEICYLAAFSKQELRRVIALYPLKEVQKGLDSLYKKVEKHLCEEENLLQVVWRAMQEEFIAQYKYLEEHIQQCYPGSMIALDFTIKDILETFSEIALSH